MCVFLKSLGAASGLHHFGNIQSLQDHYLANRHFSGLEKTVKCIVQPYAYCQLILDLEITAFMWLQDRTLWNSGLWVAYGSRLF